LFSLFEFVGGTLTNSIAIISDAIHDIGDSLSSDVKGAATVGIDAIWINRGGRTVPEGVTAVGNLLEVLDTEYFK